MINNLCVLYVEDDEIVRENFQEILEQHFPKVITANNGKTALELYDMHKPDIAILDISIPYLSGLQVASKIRKTNSQIQIIMLTAYDDKEKLLDAVNLQLFAYLVKPVQHQDFDLILKKLLSKFENKNMIQLASAFIWNKETKELFYKEEQIKLTNNERLALSLLANNPNQYFTAYDIALEILENYNSNDLEANNIVQLLSRFKKKTSKNFKFDSFFIENCYGAGYRIILA